jgi:hypothetical protein
MLSIIIESRNGREHPDESVQSVYNHYMRILISTRSILPFLLNLLQQLFIPFLH